MRVAKFVQSVVVASLMAVVGGGAIASGPEPVKAPTTTVKVEGTPSSNLTINKNSKFTKQTKFGKQVLTKRPSTIPPQPQPDPAHKP